MAEVLAHVQATELLGHSPQGQTVPLIFRGRDRDGGLSIYQAKVASRRNGLTHKELACEIFCTFLAASVGMHVANPACLHLAHRVARAIEETYGMQLTSDHAAAVRFVRYLRPLVLPTDLDVSTQTCSQARHLAFDLLVVNGDRTAANPNFDWDHEKLFVFDFEHCFELPDGEPTQTLQMHLDLLPNLRASHVFGSVAETPVLMSEIGICLDLMVAAPIMRDMSGLPESWQAWCQKTANYLQYISEHRGVIIERLSSSN